MDGWKRSKGPPGDGKGVPTVLHGVRSLLRVRLTTLYRDRVALEDVQGWASGPEGPCWGPSNDRLWHESGLFQGLTELGQEVCRRLVNKFFPTCRKLAGREGRVLLREVVWSASADVFAAPSRPPRDRPTRTFASLEAFFDYVASTFCARAMDALAEECWGRPQEVAWPESEDEDDGQAWEPPAPDPPEEFDWSGELERFERALRESGAEALQRHWAAVQAAVRTMLDARRDALGEDLHAAVTQELVCYLSEEYTSFEFAEHVLATCCQKPNTFAVHTKRLRDRWRRLREG